jgi:hypothetical protein
MTESSVGIRCIGRFLAIPVIIAATVSMAFPQGNGSLSLSHIRAGSPLRLPESSAGQARWAFANLRTGFE